MTGAKNNPCVCVCEALKGQECKSFSLHQPPQGVMVVAMVLQNVGRKVMGSNPITEWCGIVGPDRPLPRAESDSHGPSGKAGTTQPTFIRITMDVS